MKMKNKKQVKPEEKIITPETKIKAKSKPINKKELEALTASMKSTNKIKAFFDNLYETLTTPINKITWASFTFLLVLVFSFTFVITWNVSSDFNMTPTNEQGLMYRLDNLKQSHTYYTTMATKDELLIAWIKSFSSWNYSLGGDPRLSRGDCTGAVFTFLRQWNSNVHFENVNATARRAENLVTRGEMQKRSSINDIETGDLIILKVGDVPDHIGIVYDTPNGFVRYMDVNALVQGWDLPKRRFDDKVIYGIYSMSYSFWLGDLMKQVNERL